MTLELSYGGLLYLDRTPRSLPATCALRAST